MGLEAQSMQIRGRMCLHYERMLDGQMPNGQPDIQRPNSTLRNFTLRACKGVSVCNSYIITLQEGETSAVSDRNGT
jgi:hypothetical protein